MMMDVFEFMRPKQLTTLNLNENMFNNNEKEKKKKKNFFKKSKKEVDEKLDTINYWKDKKDLPKNSEDSILIINAKENTHSQVKITKTTTLRQVMSKICIKRGWNTEDFVFRNNQNQHMNLDELVSKVSFDVRPIFLFQDKLVNTKSPRRTLKTSSTNTKEIELKTQPIQPTIPTNISNPSPTTVSLAGWVSMKGI